MSIPHELTTRLGFNAWAENVIMNVIENGNQPIDTEDMTVTVTRLKGHTHYALRAHIDGTGWASWETTVNVSTCNDGRQSQHHLRTGVAVGCVRDHEKSITPCPGLSVNSEGR